MSTLNDEVRVIVSKAEAAAADAAAKYFSTVLGRVDQGACGFAWATVYGVKGSTKLGKALVAAGFRKAYTGGLEFWMPGRQPCQNVDVHDEGARAFAKVIAQELNVECYHNSRLD